MTFIGRIIPGAADFHEWPWARSDLHCRPMVKPGRVR